MKHAKKILVIDKVQCYRVMKMNPVFLTKITNKKKKTFFFNFNFYDNQFEI